MLRPGARPDPDTLDLLLGLWTRRKTGKLQVPWSPIPAQLIDGEPADEDTLSWLQDALIKGRVYFRGGTSQAEGALPSMAPLLLEAARRLADEPEVLGRLNHGVVDGPRASALDRLPLPRAVRRMLGARIDPRLSAGDLIRAGRMSIDDAVPWIALLVALKVLRLRPVSSASAASRRDPTRAPRPRSRRKLAARERKPKPSRAARSPSPDKADLLRRRLEREWKTVNDADDWTVMGIPRDPAPGLLDRAAQRLQERYSGLKADNDLPADVRELANKLDLRVREAVFRIREGAPRESERQRGSRARNTDPATALKRGREALRRKDHARGVGWLHFAHQKQPDSAEIAAWYGWAILHDPRRDREERVRKGLDQLNMAVLMEESSRPVLLLMARGLAATGDLPGARVYLKRLRRLHPDFQPAINLLARVEDSLGREPLGELTDEADSVINKVRGWLG